MKVCIRLFKKYNAIRSNNNNFCYLYPVWLPLFTLCSNRINEKSADFFTTWFFYILQ